MANPISRIITVQAAAGDVTFNLELDSNAASVAPSSYISGWTTAANLLSAAIQIPITVNLEIGYTEYPKDNSSEGSGSASATTAYTVTDSYQQLRNLLLSNGSTAVDAAVNALPNTTSLNGFTSFQVAAAEAKVWGQVSATNSAIDGYAGFGANIGASEIVGVALHEFTHAIGRLPGASVLSLFRYTSVGQHDFDPNWPTGASYFSIDGGNTDVADFGQTSDPSDFLNPPNSNRTPNDPFNEFYNTSTTQTLTPLDLTVLAMLGFSGAHTTTGDDYANSLTDTSHPFGQVSVGGSATGTLEVLGDRDWFSIQLSAGVTYTINLQGQHSGLGTLPNPDLRLHSSTGALLAQDDDVVPGSNPDSALTYQATTTGTYYIEAGASNDASTGTYKVSAAVMSAPDDYANSLTDTSHPFGQVAVGGSATGTLEVAGDRDWFRVQLSAGTTYTIDLLGQQSAAGTLADPYLRLHDSTGALLAQDDDIVPAVDLDSQLIYSPTASGTFYIEAGAFADASIGTYRVSVDTGLTTAAEASGATYSTRGSTLLSGSQVANTWTGTATETISNGDTWTALAGTMAEEVAYSTNLSGSGSVFTDPVLLGLGAPYADSGLAVSGNGQASANEAISYNFSAPVAAGNSFILWAPGASFNSVVGPYTFTVSASLGGSALQTSGWSFDLRSPFGAALPGTFAVNAQTGTVTINNYNSNPFAAVIITPNAPLDHIAIVANTIENDLWGFAFTNAATPPLGLGPTIAGLSAASDSGAIGDNITNVATPVITGTGQAGETLTLLDGNNAIGTATIGADGKWSITSGTLADGVHVLTATQTDAAGNTSSASSPVSLTIDTTAPAISTNNVLSVAAGGKSVITSSLLASTDAAGGTSSLAYTVTGTPANGTLLVNGKAATQFTQADINSGAVSYAESNTAASADSFTFTVTDVAGNTTAGQFQVQIPPALPGGYAFSSALGPVSLGLSNPNGVAPGPSTAPGALNLEIFTQTGLTSLPALDTVGGVPFVAGILDPGGAFVPKSSLVSGANLKLFSGDYLLSDATGGATITLGSGNQSVFGAQFDTLIGGSGARQTLNVVANDSVVAGTGSAFAIIANVNDRISGPATGATTASGGQFVLGANDRVSLPALGNYTVSAATGDTIVAAPGSANLQIGGTGASVNLSGNTGTNTLLVGTTKMNFTAGAGPATIYGGANDTVSLGSGNAYFDGTGAAPSHPNLSFSQMVNIGNAGNDVILSGTGNTVNGGAAALSLQFLAPGVNLNLSGQTGAFSPSVYGASGDTVTAGPNGAASTVPGITGTVFYIDGGAGNMQIVAGPAGPTDLVFGSTVAGAPDTVTGSAAALNFQGRASGETINLAGSTGNATVNAFSLGGTNDTITAGNGATSVFGGAGNRIGIGATNPTGTALFDHSTTGPGAAIAFGTNDSVASSSTAKVSVTNFNTTTDTVFYAGHTGTGNNAQDAAIIAAAATSGGNTTITLPDGTQMIFAGLASAAALKFTS